jgi:hypothetical protein
MLILKRVFHVFCTFVVLTARPDCQSIPGPPLSVASLLPAEFLGEFNSVFSGWSEAPLVLSASG